MKEFGNIVGVHPAGISETLLATPVAAALRERYPAARITWLCDPALASMLLSYCPHIDEVSEIARQTARFFLIKAILSLQPDLVVNLTPTRIKKLMLFASPAHVVETEETDIDSHEVHYYLSALEPLGVRAMEKPFPTIFPQPLAGDLLQQLQAIVGSDHKALVGIAPGVGADNTNRSWIEDGWIYLVNHFSKSSDRAVILLGGEADKALCQQIHDGSEGQCINTAGQFTLSESAALIKGCAVVIGGDGGLLHLAEAVGTPTVGLFGPTSPAVRGTLNPHSIALDLSNRCECAGYTTCHDFGVVGAGDCMRKISLEDILAATARILSPASIPTDTVC